MLEEDSLEFEALLPNIICLPVNNLPSLNLRFLACKTGLITLILESYVRIMGCMDLWENDNTVFGP